MNMRDVWKLRLILIRFMREATPSELVRVTEYAARVMCKQAREGDDGTKWL